MLRQAWIDSPCSPGSFVHVIGDFDRFGQCIIDNTQNLLILHPDHLISSTVVGDSFTCTRKAVLQDRVKATSDANQGTIYGHLLHEIFQEALRANRWDNEFLDTTIENFAPQYLENLFEIQIELVTAIEHLKARVGDLQAWAEIFISARPKVCMTNRSQMSKADIGQAQCCGQGSKRSTVTHEHQQTPRGRGEGMVTIVRAERQCRCYSPSGVKERQRGKDIDCPIRIEDGKASKRST